MLDWLRSKGDLRRRATQLHEAIVDASRAPELYARHGVPDTIDGRIEMLALHLVIVLDRLQRLGSEGQAMAVALTEAYVIAMDDAMREFGVGDLTVPRKVKKAAAALYDRNRTYGPPLAASHAGDMARDAWRAALSDAVKDVAGADSIDLAALSDHAQRQVEALTRLPDQALLAGRLEP